MLLGIHLYLDQVRLLSLLVIIVMLLLLLSRRLGDRPGLHTGTFHHLYELGLFILVLEVVLLLLIRIRGIVLLRRKVKGLWSSTAAVILYSLVLCTNIIRHYRIMH